MTRWLTREYLSLAMEFYRVIKMVYRSQNNMQSNTQQTGLVFFSDVGYPVGLIPCNDTPSQEDHILTPPGGEGGPGVLHGYPGPQ